MVEGQSTKRSKCSNSTLHIFCFFFSILCFSNKLFSMIPARMTAKFGATGVDNDREQESEFFLKTKVGIKN